MFPLNWSLVLDSCCLWMPPLLHLGPTNAEPFPESQLEERLSFLAQEVLSAWLNFDFQMVFSSSMAAPSSYWTGLMSGLCLPPNAFDLPWIRCHEPCYNPSWDTITDNTSWDITQHLEEVKQGNRLLFNKKLIREPKGYPQHWLWTFPPLEFIEKKYGWKQLNYFLNKKIVRRDMP